MADPVILDLDARTAKLDAKLDAVNKQLKDIEGNSKEAGQDMTKSFDKSTKAVDKTDKATSKLDKSLISIGKRIGAAFAVSKIVDFTTRAVKLAGELQGVEKAFNRLNNPRLLSELRTATRGTVTDLELMKQAVRAQNFKVPLEQLGTFFEFATKRAIQTGESVDYLTNSIIDGIGRKSTLVLDNLGISATELQEEIKKVGDFGTAAGNIIERQLGNMGDVSNTAATETARLNTAIENLTTLIGTKLTPVVADLAEILTKDITKISEVVETDALSSFDKWTLALAKAMNNFGQFDGLIKTFTDRIEEARRASEEENKVLNRKADVLGAITDFLDDKKEDVVIQKGIVQALKDQIAAYDKLIPQQQTQEALNSVLEKREAVEKRLNEVLNARNQIVSEDPLLDLDGSIFDTLDEQSEQDALNRFIDNETEATNVYEEELAKRAEADAAYFEFKQANEIKQQELEDENRRATLQATANLFGALSGLLSEHAEAQKAVAIAEAIINGYLGITAAFTLPPPASFVAAAATAVATGAAVLKIQQQEIPRYYDGIDYLQLNGNKKGKDTIPVMAHEGEAIINAARNSEHKGLAKAWNDGRADEWINANYVLPALNNAIMENKRKENIEMANLIGQNFFSNSSDPRVVTELKRSRKLQEAQLGALTQSKRSQRFRA